jgi:hypothetical protein
MTGMQPAITAFANIESWTFPVVRHGKQEGKP